MDVQASWFGMETPEVHPPDQDLPEGTKIAVEGLTGIIHHTPGHTQGSVCLYLPEQSLLLAGDTLFAGSVGRTDLPGGNTRQLIDSIHTHLMPLPEKPWSSPATAPATTIGAERDTNPFLQK